MFPTLGPMPVPCLSVTRNVGPLVPTDRLSHEHQQGVLQVPPQDCTSPRQ